MSRLVSKTTRSCGDALLTFLPRYSQEGEVATELFASDLTTREDVVTSSSHLETFLAVLRAGSFAAAAEDLNRSPSAVSQQIASFEQKLGTTLFLRHARRIEPTPAAGEVREQARRILAQLDDLRRRARENSQEKRLVIGLFPSFAQRIIASLQPFLASQEIHTQYLVAESPMLGHALTAPGPEEAGLDLGFVFHIGAGSPAVTGALRKEWIGDEPFDVVLPASWKISQEATALELTRLGWILHHPGTADAAIMERALTFDGQSPVIAARSDDFAASLELVRSAVGAALIPRSVINRSSPQGLDVRRGTEIRLVRGLFALSPRESEKTILADTVITQVRSLLEEG